MTKNQNGILVVEEMKTYSNLRPSRFAAGKNVIIAVFIYYDEIIQA